ncbi:hypothetical protein, partial [Paracoccus benzoatiresistens]
APFVDRCRPTLAHQMPSGGGHIINAHHLVPSMLFSANMEGIMSDEARGGKFLGQRVGEKQIHKLIGIASGLLAEGQLSVGEIEFLHRWLAGNDGARANRLVAQLVGRLHTALADGAAIDEDGRADLFSTMQALTANDFELGEILKAATLPLCNPAPDLDFAGSRMCFTGTLTFGTRKDCEAAASAQSAICGSLT